MNKELEILAPAGSPEILRVALAAGADAVYFGLKRLNARRGARNISAAELADCLAQVKAAGAKAYLTLNIDLTERELGLAARTLHLAAVSGVDAVLVRDPALLALRQHFPGLAFHFSTQAGISSAAGMRAAAQLGVTRVVLARELSGREIAEAGRQGEAAGVETEVFVQGALCFSCSGRCLLSSWVGGRSGNRGVCASPCRVGWRRDGQAEAERLLSMHDLCLADKLAELRAAGVASLKIEGRLKSADWVAEAVRLYVQARNGNGTDAELLQAAASLGEYTGRQLTAGYYEARYTGLTGESGRLPAENPAENPPGGDEPAAENDERALPAIAAADGDGATLLTLSAGAESEVLRIPRQHIANPRRAVRLAELLGGVTLGPQTAALAEVRCPEALAGRLLPRRFQNSIQSAFNDFLRRVSKGDDGMLRLELPEPLRGACRSGQGGCAENRLPLGQAPDLLRGEVAQLAVLATLKRPLHIVCAPQTTAEAEALIGQLQPCRALLRALALPAVLYDTDAEAWQPLLRYCRESGLAVEVNSWDGWCLAGEAAVPRLGGPGLAVLNSRAAAFLHGCGCQESTIALEADRRQIEELCQGAETPLTLTVFARPPLLQSRASLELAAGSFLVDGRGVMLQLSRTGGLSCFRPLQPFDWRRLRHWSIRVAHLLMDFCGSADPLADWQTSEESPFLFNFDRTLR